jgi:hypothetical protein
MSWQVLIGIAHPENGDHSDRHHGPRMRCASNGR